MNKLLQKIYDRHKIQAEAELVDAGLQIIDQDKWHLRCLAASKKQLFNLVLFALIIAWVIYSWVV